MRRARSEDSEQSERPGGRGGAEKSAPSCVAAATAVVARWGLPANESEGEREKGRARKKETEGGERDRVARGGESVESGKASARATTHSSLRPRELCVPRAGWLVVARTANATPGSFATHSPPRLARKQSADGASRCSEKAPQPTEKRKEKR